MKLIIICFVVIAMLLSGCQCDTHINLGLITDFEYYPPATTALGIGTAHYMITTDSTKILISATALNNVRTGGYLFQYCGGFYGIEESK